MVLAVSKSRPWANIITCPMARFLILVALMAGACQSWRIDDLSSEPIWAIPLAYGSFSLTDLIKQNPHIDAILVENDVLVLVYRGDDLVIRGADYLPGLAAELPLIMTDTLVRFPLPAIQGFSIVEGTLTGSSAIFTANSPFSQDVQVVFTSEELRHGDKPWRQEFAIKYSGAVPVNFRSEPVSLQGILLRPARNQIGLQYKVTTQNTSLGKLNLATATIKGLGFNYLRGYSGRRSLMGGPQVIPIDFYRDFEGGKVVLSAPKITLKVTNTLGVPVGAEVSDLYASGPETERFAITSTLLSGPLEFAYPEQPGDEPKITNLEINAQNANLEAAFAIQPHQIAFKVDFIMNPQNLNQAFWLTDTGYLRIESKIQVPLQGHVDYFMVHDTVAMNLEGIPAHRNLAIHGFSDNQLPLSAEINAELLNTDGSSQGMLWPNFQLISHQEGRRSFDLPLPLSSEQVSKSNRMVVRVRFAHQGSAPYAIKASQTFSYQLGLRYSGL